MGWGLTPQHRNIPAELRGGPWCVFKIVQRPNGKYDKVPCSSVTGRGLSTKEPDTWLTFTEVVTAYNDGAAPWGGVGRLVLPDDDMTVIDLDKCVEPVTGQPQPWAQQMVDELASYTEYSPSGTGLRIVVTGRLPDDIGHSSAGLPMEAYSGHTARYVTYTGIVYRDLPIATLPEPAAWFARHSTKPPVRRTSTPPLPNPSPGETAAALIKATGELPADLSSWLFDENAPPFAVTDRSVYVSRCAHSLWAIGLDATGVYAALAASRALEVALDHRGQDDEKARKWLWEHHVWRNNPAQGFDALTAAPAAATPASYDTNPVGEAGPTTPGEAAPGADSGEKTSKVTDIESVGNGGGNGGGNGEQPPAHPFLHLSDVAVDIKPVEWLIEGYIERNATGVLYGPPGSYKTFMAMSWALSIAAGTGWAGGFNAAQGPVLYIAGEGHRGIGRRAAAWLSANSQNAYEVPFYITPGAVQISDLASVTNLIVAIKALAAQSSVPPSLVVIDTLARNFGPADENSTADMNRFVSHCDTLIRGEVGCSVLIVHHSAKGNPQAARGSGVLLAGCDFEYRVEQPLPGWVTLTGTKMKDAPEPPVRWFAPLEIDLGTGGTSMVLDPCEPPVLSDNETEDSEVTNEDKVRAVYERVADSEGWADREEVRRVSIAPFEEGGEGLSAEAIRVVVQRLRKKGAIEEKEDGEMVRFC